MVEKCLEKHGVAYVNYLQFYEELIASTWNYLNDNPFLSNIERNILMNDALNNLLHLGVLRKV